MKSLIFTCFWALTLSVFFNAGGANLAEAKSLHVAKTASQVAVVSVTEQERDSSKCSCKAHNLCQTSQSLIGPVSDLISDELMGRGSLRPLRISYLGAGSTPEFDPPPPRFS